jgi:hypothetical protein
MSIGAEAYTEIIASTREAIDTQELVDNVITQHPLLELFKDNARSYTGRNVVVNVEGAENGSTEFTDESGSFSTAIDGDLVGTAVFDWSAPMVSKTRLAFKTIEMNQGKEQIVDLVKTHLKAAEKGHAKALAQALYASVPAIGAPLSLPVLVDDGNEVGGIDGDDKAYWNSVRITHGSDKPAKVAFRETLNTLFIAGDGARPTHILCGVDVYERYESQLDEAARAMMTANPSTIDGRFRELKFDGLTVRLDPDCPASEAYFLNKDDLVLGYLGDNWMKVQPAQVVPGTLDYVTPIASVVVFGVRQRRSHARIDFAAAE